jgi:hypothetical protein
LLFCKEMCAETQPEMAQQKDETQESCCEGGIGWLGAGNNLDQRSGNAPCPAQELATAWENDDVPAEKEDGRLCRPVFGGLAQPAHNSVSVRASESVGGVMLVSWIVGIIPKAQVSPALPVTSASPAIPKPDAFANHSSALVPRTTAFTIYRQCGSPYTLPSLHYSARLPHGSCPFDSG